MQNLARETPLHRRKAFKAGRAIENHKAKSRESHSSRREPSWERGAIEAKPLWVF